MESLRQEADRLLAEFGLLEILREYGEPHVIGSVSMDLMAWPDLDIDVLNTGMCLEKLHRLTGTLLERFSPVWYEAKEELTDEGKTVWFHGLETEITGTRWNIDIWFFDKETIEKAETYCTEIREKINENPSLQEAVLTLKKELLSRGLYSFEKYRSMDVYKAVLELGICDIDTFLTRYRR
ncbi:MAG: hypothetical protein E7631_11490 [Ruminococcaceae bacterium]|nr:hypothetical protein [Oscillospiraceae bacterium]